MDPDGWVRNTRPYSWARGLCTKEDARRALEEFVSVGPSNGDDDSAFDDDEADDANHLNSVHDEDAGSCDEIAPRDGSCSDGVPRSNKERVRRKKKKNRAKEVYSEALRQIAAMRAWFATQRELHLLGSSVLIVYEGDDRTGHCGSGNDEGSIPVRVKAIDFCNYVEGAGELDTNFGAGLDRLSVMLESIVAAS